MGMVLKSIVTYPKPTVISRSKENNCIHFLISHEIMASVLKLVLILCMVCMFNCNKTNLILKNKSINDCPNYDDTVSSTNVKSLSLIDEFTFCGRFSFKFLKDSVLMSLEVSKTYIRLIDFERNYGLLQHDYNGQKFREMRISHYVMRNLISRNIQCEFRVTENKGFFKYWGPLLPFGALNHRKIFIKTLIKAFEAFQPNH